MLSLMTFVCVVPIEFEPFLNNPGRLLLYAKLIASAMNPAKVYFYYRHSKVERFQSHTRDRIQWKTVFLISVSTPLFFNAVTNEFLKSSLFTAGDATSFCKERE